MATNETESLEPVAYIVWEN